MGYSFNLIIRPVGALRIHNGGIRPNAIIPEPNIAAIDRSDVWTTALTEFKNNSGAAEPNATKVTAIKIQTKQIMVILNLLRFIEHTKMLSWPATSSGTSNCTINTSTVGTRCSSHTIHNEKKLMIKAEKLNTA